MDPESTLENTDSKLHEWNVPHALREIVSRLCGNFPGRDELMSFRNAKVIPAEAFMNVLNSTDAETVRSKPADRNTYTNRLCMVMINQALTSGTTDATTNRLALLCSPDVKEVLFGSTAETSLGTGGSHLPLEHLASTLMTLNLLYSAREEDVRSIKAKPAERKMIIKLWNTKNEAKLGGLLGCITANAPDSKITRYITGHELYGAALHDYMSQMSKFLARQ